MGYKSEFIRVQHKGTLNDNLNEIRETVPFETSDPVIHVTGIFSLFTAAILQCWHFLSGLFELPHQHKK
jgi:hypothetical protein